MENYKEILVDYVSEKLYKASALYQMPFFEEADTKEKIKYENALGDLLREGRVVETKKGKVMLPERLNMYAGQFFQLSNGNGYVKLEDLSEIFIFSNDKNTAMHRDTVLAQVTSTERGRRGEIVKILKRGNNVIVGEYDFEGRMPVCIPEDRKIAGLIYLPKQNMPGLLNHKIVVKITKYLTQDQMPEGKIIEDLGHKDVPGVDIMAVVYAKDIPHKFPEDVIMEAEALPDCVLENEKENRVDLTDELTVTIDGEDTKDVDDAVSIVKLANGNFLLTVSIADVTHYVKERSRLDKEALLRGTSVYLADRVIPMLPQKLSNGICSLNEQVERLALSCRMEVDVSGRVINHEIFESVILVDKKMTYDIVNELLTVTDSSLKEQYSDLLDMFHTMKELCEILRYKREERGAIEFGFPEARVELDAYGKTKDVVLRHRNLATAIIEEFMILCNETVAEQYYWLKLPFVYRCHEEPDSERMRVLTEFIARMGYSFKGKSKAPKTIQSLLKKVENTPEEMIVANVTLRSLKQARYTPENVGHFGLASKFYCHFTSPIRRYPDLQIHRIIKEDLKHKLSGERILHYEMLLPEVCSKSCLTERRAESCQREVETMKKVEFMADKVGQTFDGIITGVTGWGIYVSLPNTVEGMVSIMGIDDNFEFDADNQCYVGEFTNRVYRLGQKVRVKLVRTDVRERKIDFKII